MGCLEPNLIVHNLAHALATFCIFCHFIEFNEGIAGPVFENIHRILLRPHKYFTDDLLKYPWIRSHKVGVDLSQFEVILLNLKPLMEDAVVFGELFAIVSVASRQSQDQIQQPHSDNIEMVSCNLLGYVFIDPDFVEVDLRAADGLTIIVLLVALSHVGLSLVRLEGPLEHRRRSGLVIYHLDTSADDVQNALLTELAFAFV